MRILHVIHQFFPDCHSGTEQYCLAVAREGRRRGDDITVLSMHWDHQRAHPTIDLFEQPLDRFQRLTGGLDLADRLIGAVLGRCFMRPRL